MKSIGTTLGIAAIRVLKIYFRKQENFFKNYRLYIKEVLWKRHTIFLNG